MTSQLMNELQHLQSHIQQVIPSAQSVAIKPLQAMLKRLKSASQNLEDYDPDFDDKVVLEQAQMVIHKTREVLAEHSLLEVEEIQTIDVQWISPEVHAAAQLWHTGPHWQQLPSGEVHLDFDEVLQKVTGKIQSNDLNVWRVSLKPESRVHVDLRLKP